MLYFACSPEPFAQALGGKISPFFLAFKFFHHLLIFTMDVCSMKEQIISHIDFAYCTNNSPQIYVHTLRQDKYERNVNMSFDLRDFLEQESPLVFIDDGSKHLPSPAVLARFHIVITSYNRFTAEVRFSLLIFLSSVALSYLMPLIEL